MQSKNITMIIIESTNTYCKFVSDLTHDVECALKHRYLVKFGGDITEYVNAKLENRVPNKYLHNVPVLHVVLYDTRKCKENDIESCYFLASRDLENEYNIVSVNTSKIASQRDLVTAIVEKVQNFVANIEYDKEVNTFNVLYKKGAEKYKLKVTVKDNQPYLENQMFMADFQYHNGLYETYDNKTMPDTLLYAAAYANTKTDLNNKEFDFQYPINSKVMFRPEVKAYTRQISNFLTLLTTESHYLDDAIYSNNVTMFKKVFGDEYIEQLSRAKATIITNRELAHTEMMTARWYEAVLANNVIFVDSCTDVTRKVLTQIHKDDAKLIDLLTVLPETIVKNYRTVMKDQNLVKKIIDAQHIWFENLLNSINAEKIKKDFT